MRKEINVTSYIEQHQDSGEDALEIKKVSHGYLFCLADGVGGVFGGANASNFISSLNDVPEMSSPDDFEEYLRKKDAEMLLDDMIGETTVIIGKVVDQTLFGASIGDSEAWFIGSDYEYSLTNLQHRTPKLGSGRAIPVGFGPINLEGNILIASDGLFNFSDFIKVIHLSRNSNSVAKDFRHLAQTKSGNLQDDLSVIYIQGSHN